MSDTGDSMPRSLGRGRKEINGSEVAPRTKTGECFAHDLNAARPKEILEIRSKLGLPIDVARMFLLNHK